MLLDEYLDDIKETLARTAPFVVDHDLTIDRRAQEQAHIFGFLTLLDESCLHFREFIDGWLRRLCLQSRVQLSFTG